MADYTQEVTKCYTVNFSDDGMLESILVEEDGGFGRWMYKRTPKGMELPLTDHIFEETVEAFLDDGGILEANELYKILRKQDKYYADLMLKAYKTYIKLYVLNSNLHQDAFWGK